MGIWPFHPQVRARILPHGRLAGNSVGAAGRSARAVPVYWAMPESVSSLRTVATRQASWNVL